MDDMIALTRTYGRYGHRRIAAMLRYQLAVNDKRIERLWRQEGPKVPVKQPKKGRLWLNDDSCIRQRQEHQNHVWSYDFVHHRTGDGRAFRTLNIIDELHLDYPFAGSRMLAGLLRQDRRMVGWLHVSTLMKSKWIGAIYRRPNTFGPAPGHKVNPYLLHQLAIPRPNRIWAMDITFERALERMAFAFSLPMARGFVYLAAVVDWFTRTVLTWRRSIAVEDAMARYGKPEIMNTDQGSQFTPIAFITTSSAPGSQSALTATVRGSGARSNTRRSVCRPTRQSPRRGLQSAGF